MPVIPQPLVDDLLPEYSVHLLAGAPGAGKTCLAAWLLNEIQEGRPVFGRRSHPPTAMGVVVADRKWLSHAHWFDAVGLGDIPHYSLIDDTSFNLKRLDQHDGYMASLLRAIGELKLPVGGLLLVDPLSFFLGGELLHYGRVSSAMAYLSRLCVQRQITILGTAHAAKQRAARQFQYTRPQDRILGSAALLGFADTVMYLAPPAETNQRYWELTVAPHETSAITCRFTRDRYGLFELEGRPERTQSGGQGPLTRREEIVLSCIGDEPAPTRAVVDQALTLGLSQASVYRALGDLAQRRLILTTHGQVRRAPPIRLLG